MTARRVLAAVPDSGAIEVAMLAVDALVMGDDYRLDDDPEALGELTESITTYGLLQPLLVRPVANGYEVVAGRRRLAASRAAGLVKVPCVVRGLSTEEALDAALVENLHRRDLSPIEIALALARMRDEQGLTQTVIAERVGRSGGYVSLILRLLDMPKNIQNKVHAGKMSYRTAYDVFRRGSATGGVSTQGSGSLADFRAASHWRRRHDRLVVAINAVLRERPRDVGEFRLLLNRVLKLDREPLPEEAERPEGKRPPSRFKEAAS